MNTSALMIPTTPGIYVIRCTQEAKVYVGSAVNLNLRWKIHLVDLRACKHHSHKLQRAFRRFGAAAFTFEVQEECPPEELIHREQLLLDALDAVDKGYNVCRTAGSRLGMKHTDATRKLLSDKAKKRPPITEETRKKLSQAKKGKPKSEATRRNMSEAASKRPPRSAATIEKHRAAITGRPGHKHPQEHKDYMRDKMLGRVISEETRERIRQSWERRRAVWGASGSPKPVA